ncbi:TetR/AcrR family transcriptional regulator [Paenibacillus alvei]|uniref:TetR/AcrR family transcriptional regulator n=1 Tax=Paenibacillus alvei TaxID=44250 RepID=UPI00227F9B7A|nr:TetR/AcrR family transcriptional regulator [Paenibacillus alvei]MBG9734850.1 transcriptional regulator [Paenibacillus alvei]MBG9744725.1 transcriptional regulator [Paenibacillus alvei]MCY9578853.1 TetR/AcrR family transcriptional regulator [Paenibacillus alvei]MCY9583909.1 TetR/AcrR family transcriptional regulator [Paenibacillus alvei]
MKDKQTLDSKSRLMLAAIDLMAEKGYKGVSTKEIASAAGVSEMTLFRNFGSKLNLLENAVERYHYSVEMTRIFNETVTWDLRKDLLGISQMYHEIMDRNRKLFLIVLRDDELIEIREKAQKHPRKLLELLTQYFTDMQSRNRMIQIDAETQAITFMWMNYGAFMTQLFGATTITKVSLQAFIESSIELFVRGVSP